MRSILSNSATSGRTIATGLVVAALVATLAALLLPVQLFGETASAATNTVTYDDDGGGTVNTRYGPLTAMDRDFVRKVRLAGLWELPAGRQAQERGQTAAVRTAGATLVAGHTELDRRSIEAGRALGISLPNQPNADQQGWLAQMNAAQGDEFAPTFAELLRRAHGKVFGLVAMVRDQTKNSMVRALANRANDVVLQHITVLEKTGSVDFNTLHSS
ncbi:DUF4142 domain-containing protein [Streptomyces libani]|uniref:DUF4142 domain-containing protein n=2 Tax=Streptomyces nigrescens TaxID=1920 RepID=A0A640TLZ5_STRNI|nr:MULTISPECIES: DUF4142 domain-containing protein [Streptomyces]MCW7987169.1 hypothetical protein [Streptomyces platensis subsp. clarensis]MYX10508.1 DUF4142 domain-containing protein [Streptomyces sp. SID8375]AWN27424.1 DUF4142 domain-containing protein [Streptomyces sp. NEAU-S7GS2]MCX5447147.1 DUF4142 domain-containing protein [Streptomyces libani]WAT98823.1 DUF4142 domain-containing protein [Streptomyces libani subsp. libani]